MKIFVSLTLVLVFSVKNQAVCQDTQVSGWLASFNTIKLDKKWSLHLELQLRSTDHLEQIQTILPRTGLNYHVKSNQIITAGYAYIPNRVAAFDQSALLAEHRFWQQFIINQNIASAVLTHRFRLEQRFVPVAAMAGNELKVKERIYSSRLRYFARAVIPFKTQKPFVNGAFAALQEEIFFNVTDRHHVNGKWFDQNRVYGAFGYRFSKRFDLEIGYLNQFIERRSGRQNLVSHVFQLAFYTRL